MTTLQRLGRWRLLRWLLIPLVALCVALWQVWRRRRLQAERYQAAARVLHAELDLQQETRRAEAAAEVERDTVRAAHTTAVTQLARTEQRIEDLNRETLAAELNRVFGRTATGGKTP